MGNGGYWRRQPRGPEGRWIDENMSFVDLVKMQYAYDTKEVKRRQSVMKSGKGGATTRRVQSKHRKDLLIRTVGEEFGGFTGGVGAAVLVGGSTVNPILGSMVMGVGGALGTEIGGKRARSISRKQGWHYSDDQIRRLSAANQSAIYRREKRVKRALSAAHFGIDATRLAVSLDQVLKDDGAYQRMYQAASKRGDRIKYAQAMGLPRNESIMKAKVGRGGVYKVTSLAGSRMKR